MRIPQAHSNVPKLHIFICNYRSNRNGSMYICIYMIVPMQTDNGFGMAELWHAPSVCIFSTLNCHRLSTCIKAWPILAHHRSNVLEYHESTLSRRPILINARSSAFQMIFRGNIRLVYHPNGDPIRSTSSMARAYRVGGPCNFNELTNQSIVGIWYSSKVL